MDFLHNDASCLVGVPLLQPIQNRLEQRPGERWWHSVANLPTPQGQVVTSDNETRWEGL